jgi:ubiquinone/menaquinone biosynthesis C-methylase UbiE
MYPASLDFLGPVAGKRVLLCGVGEEAVALAEAGADVYGFDTSHTRVEAAKDLARQLGLRHQTHFQALAHEALPYPDGFFDLAFVQPHVDVAKQGKELARVLKRGGQTAVMTYSGEW